MVVGSGGGLGSAFVKLLEQSPSFGSVIQLSRSNSGADHIDLLDEDSIAAAAERVRAGGAPALIVVATGLLHDDADLQPEKHWGAIRPESMQRSMAINAIGPALVAKHFLPLLPRRQRSVMAILSARVGSISDNRLGGWVSYRASKAALNMIIKTLSIELKRRNPDGILVGLHPGTVDTALSRPFQGNVPEGKLFSAPEAAGHLLSVIDQVEPDQSGMVMAWDGTEVPA